MNKLTIISGFIALFFTSFLSCSSDSDTNNQVTTSNRITVSNYGFGDDSSSIWVQCSGHTKRTRIELNGQLLETVFYEDHLTSAIPSVFFGKDTLDFSFILIDDSLNTKTIIYQLQEISSKRDLIIIDAGIGGNNEDAIWIKCSGHSENTLIQVNGNIMETTYYSDHLTSMLPIVYSIGDSLRVQLFSNTPDSLSSNIYSFR